MTQPPSPLRKARNASTYAEFPVQPALHTLEKSINNSQVQQIGSLVFSCYNEISHMWLYISSNGFFQQYYDNTEISSLNEVTSIDGKAKYAIPNNHWEQATDFKKIIEIFQKYCLTVTTSNDEELEKVLEQLSYIAEGYFFTNNRPYPVDLKSDEDLLSPPLSPSQTLHPSSVPDSHQIEQSSVYNITDSKLSKKYGDYLVKVEYSVRRKNHIIDNPQWLDGDIKEMFLTSVNSENRVLFLTNKGYYLDESEENSFIPVNDRKLLPNFLSFFENKDHESIMDKIEINEEIHNLKKDESLQKAADDFLFELIYPI